MPDISGLPDGSEAPAPRKRGRPPKVPVPGAPPPRSHHAQPRPQTAAAPQVQVKVRLPETVYVEPIIFERMVPTMLEALAKVSDNGRLAVITQCKEPDSGKSTAQAFGNACDVAMIASGVPLGPLEMAIMNLATCAATAALMYKSLPPMTYEQGAALAQGMGAELKRAAHATNGTNGTPTETGAHN